MTFDNLCYDVDHVKLIFDVDDHWCYDHDTFIHGEDHVIARYKKDGDGYDVEVIATSMPAVFYKIVVKPTVDSCNEMRNGFELSTGTGCEKWVHQTAKLISKGMVSL